jgi:preprotein translocase subunit SecG
METLLWVIHVIVSISLVAVVLMQPGQSGGMGTAFGGGGSQSLFGSQGSSGFLGRVTAVLATAFFLTSLGLAVISTGGDESLLQEEAPAEEQAPAAPQAPDVPAIPGQSPGQGAPGSPN